MRRSIDSLRVTFLAVCVGMLAAGSPTAAADEVPQPSLSQVVKSVEHVIVFDISRKKSNAELQKLLPVVAGTNIRVLVAVQSWTTPCAANGWLNFSSLPPARRCDCKSYTTHDDRQRCKNAWLVAWKRAAIQVSKLAKAYPANVTGFIIDDFDAVAESDDNPSDSSGERVTRNDLGGLLDGLRSIHPGLPLWTTATYGVWSSR